MNAGTPSRDQRLKLGVQSWSLLLRTHAGLVPRLSRELEAERGVGLSWYDVLLELNAAPDRRLRMQELGNRVVLSRSQASRVVDELARAGLARREVDTADRRGAYAVLTDAGRETLRRAAPVYLASIARHFTQHLTNDELHAVIAGLSRVLDPDQRPEALELAQPRSRLEGLSVLDAPIAQPLPSESGARDNAQAVDCAGELAGASSDAVTAVSEGEPGIVEQPDAGIVAAPGTIVVYSDLVCSFAHLAVYRLHKARAELGLEDTIAFDHRAFPLELFNEEVNPRPGVDSEIAVVGALEPDAGWAMWHAPDWTYPSTVLPALEAVQAAKEQSLAASESLDLSLRRGFWAESRCIAQRHVILELAGEAGLDVAVLTEALDSGRARHAVIAQWRAARGGVVRCSPHLFLADGSDEANPGVLVHWANGDFGIGFPVIDADDPQLYHDLLRRAAATAISAQ